MKIAQVCPKYHPDIGGVETHVREISERIVKKGWDVEVICTSDKLQKKDKINGVKVTRFRSIAPNDAFFLAPQIYDYILNQEYDIIHAHNYHAFPALFCALAKKDRKLVFTPHYHGAGHSFIRNQLHKPYRPIGKMIFKKADKIVCVSKFELNLIKENFKIPSSKLTHIPNGINLDEFKDTKPLERKHKTILFVGRLEKYKGVQYVIQALPLLEYRLEIVGKGSYEQKLKKLASNLGVSKKIDWIRELPRSELVKHYKSADVFVMLSEHEAYGITVAEALASGTPCIVSNIDSLGEFLDNKMCFEVKLHPNANDLIQTIKSVASIERVKYGGELIDWDKVTERLIDVYEEIR
ncbi:MAG: glycosyltransferase family 4 protein [Methanocellales archaeon]|nr:glycosyltransferase family 4 protein [Methanocellales archaeon]